ncbi:hypothetical protein Tco_0142043, partial [Tanacetum coccineum]
FEEGVAVVLAGNGAVAGSIRDTAHSVGLKYSSNTGRNKINKISLSLLEGETFGVEEEGFYASPELMYPGVN